MLKVNPDAATPAEAAAGGITKMRYLRFREGASTSATLGFRVDAVQLAEGLEGAVPDSNELKSIDSVVIAKMDGTENEHPDLAVEGFPTIVFFPAREMAENEQPKSFDGERTLDGMLEWVHENANVPFEIPAAKSSGKGKKSERKEEL